jgi:ribosomal protein S18 acetylase RimI-like enzyme
MTPVSSVETFSYDLSKIKGLQKGLLTNFFLDPVRTRLWVDKALVAAQQIGETVFYARANRGFRNLYYTSSSAESLKKDLPAFLSAENGEPFVVDLVGKEDILSVADIFLQNGFHEYIALNRMSRIVAETTADVRDTGIAYAQKSDCPEILALFETYFDPLCEQIPLIEELRLWVEQGRLLLYNPEGSKIQGFLIFDLNGKTAYLRYWFVHPGYREKKIGSKLIYRFFLDSGVAKRQLFWVIGTNWNAIKRYQHYGFDKETFYDHVLINFDKRYEGENY